MPNNNNHAQNNNNTRPHNNNTFNNNMPNGNTSSMGKNGGPSDSIPKANDFMGSSSSPKGFTSQQHSFSASRNATPENGNEALLELTQSLVDQVRRLQHELTNMNARISDNENTMHRFYSTMGGLNNSINTAANFSGIKTNQESQMGNRRGQSDFESKYIWKKIERIPYFDGKNLNGLNSFISSCDSVSKTLNDFGNSEHRCAFLSEIDQKITDHAFHSSYETYDVDWEVTRGNLLNHYTYLQKSSDVMVASVENLRQTKDEDLVKYADRARALLHDLNLAYKPLTPQIKSENDKKVARYFVRGLNNVEVKRLIPLGVISNLDDSIAQVLNLEATTGSNVSARDLFCQTCRSVGHRESSCRLKNRDTNEVLTSLLLSL